MKAHTLLVIDDDESIRKALNRTLRAEGYVIHLASSGAEGLEKLKTIAFDCVISDHLMPVMTGLEVLKLVRDRRPDVGRIMLTGHADVQVALQSINEGEIHRFLTKPWDDTELKVTLYSVLGEVELGRRNRTLLAIARRQADFIRLLRRDHPEIFEELSEADRAVAQAGDELLAADEH
ncbi:MAG: response regulator [Myxococcales bacterium]